METKEPPMPYCPLETVKVERDGLTLRCTYWPLLPKDRKVDWGVVTDDYGGGENEPVGYGATMDVAIADLLEKMEDR